MLINGVGSNEFVKKLTDAHGGAEYQEHVQNVVSHIYST